jgi:quinol monooxygenase YgiN
MFRITRTLFRPAKVVAYHATLAVDQKTVSARLAVAKKAAPGFISSTVHRTSPTTKVHVETWDSKASHDAFKAANAADFEYTKTLNAAHQKSAGIKVSVFAETI